MDKVVSKKKLKKISWLFLLIFLIGCVFLGISYAYWQLTIKQKDFETLGVSCFEITLNDEQNDIKLESAYPISDEEGNNLVPYTFTITNTCDTYAYYQINLENLKESAGGGISIMEGYRMDKTILTSKDMQMILPFPEIKI